MSFNWRMAGAGLLGEAGNQANLQADRMYQLEEKRMEEEMLNRREEAKLTRQTALERLGYTEEGRPVTRGEYEALPPEERPQLYEKGKEREKPKGDEIVGYDADGGPVYASQYKPGMKLYEKGLDREKPKEPKDRKIIGYDESGAPIFDDTYDGKSPLYKDALKREGEEKPAMEPHQALKEIAQVDKAIASLNADSLSGADIANMSPSVQEMIVAFGGDAGKKMKPEDKERAIASLKEYRAELEQFAPKKRKGILNEEKEPSGMSGDAHGNAIGHKPPLNSFFR